MYSCSTPLPLSAKIKGSFAYDTVKDRLPVILTKTIDTVHKCISSYKEQFGEDGANDVKDVVGQLSKLRSEMMTDKPLNEIRDNLKDSERWNAALERLRQDEDHTPSHFKSPWLFVECAMYRQIASILQNSKFMKDFDPFCHQKGVALEKSMLGASVLLQYLQKYSASGDNGVELAKYFEIFLKLRLTLVRSNRQRLVENEVVQDLESLTRLYLHLTCPTAYAHHALMASLWSNKFDLSLSAGVSHDPGSHDPVQVVNELQEYILADEADQIFQYLSNIQTDDTKDVRVDIVLDNAGFEFLSDLCLAEFLLQSRLAQKIHFHVKNMPWLVSDVTEKDVGYTLKQMTSSNDSALSEFGKRWRSRIEDRSFIIVPEDLCQYWTLPSSYTDMRQLDKRLYEYLAQSDLVIFKGDLNFRKLVADLSWSSDTPFKNALGAFHPSPLCSLRTLKADVVVGLKSGRDLEAEKDDADWMVTGKYAVVLFDA